MVELPSLGIEDTHSCDIFAPNVSQQCPHFQLVQVYISHFFSPLVQMIVYNNWDKLASHNRGTLTPQRVLLNAWWSCHQISKMELPPSPKLPRQRTQRGWSPGATTSALSWRTASQGLMSRAATRRRPTFRLSYKWGWGGWQIKKSSLCLAPCPSSYLSALQCHNVTEKAKKYCLVIWTPSYLSVETECVNRCHCQIAKWQHRDNLGGGLTSR